MRARIYAHRNIGFYAPLEFVYLIFFSHTTMKLFTIISLAFLAFVLGCKTTTTTPEVTGDLRGTVGLFDSHGNLVADKSGVRIEAEGTSHSAISDSLGNWTIHDLPTRTYSVSFSKEGYGTMKNTSFSFVGGGVVVYNQNSPTYLLQPASYMIVLDSVLSPAPKIKDGYVYGHLENVDLGDSLNIEIDVHISKSSDLTNVQGNVGFSSNSPFGRLTKKGNALVFRYTSIWGIPDIHSGETLYFRASGFIYNPNTQDIIYPTYIDWSTGKTIVVNPAIVSNVLSSTVQ
jgi:hypothetical protein